MYTQPSNSMKASDRAATSISSEQPTLSQIQLVAKLRDVARLYPADMQAEQIADAERVAFNIRLALGQQSPSHLSICDLGGGVGLFSVGCKAIGFARSVLIDDFRDPVNLAKGDSVLDLHRSFGVEVHSRDIVAEGMGVEATFDVITSFDSMEHWHNSPRMLFQEVTRKLKPNGRFVLGVPNCVNLRKRLTVPLGYGKWSGFDEWYHRDMFRGHVREPDVSDLRAIAADMGLVNTQIIGRNWTGHASPKTITRIAARIMDLPLRAFPNLCGDIYLVGWKRGSTGLLAPLGNLPARLLSG
jgi:SAM-dependent methyltransferase